MTYHYLLFNFDLPYGEKLPVVTAVTRDEKAWLETLNRSDYEDDNYISFDGAYVSLPSFIDSLTFVELTEKLPIDRQDHIIEAIKQATVDPIELQSPADPNAKKKCPHCQNDLDDNNHCDQCVTVVFANKEHFKHYGFISGLVKETGFTDSSTTVTRDKLIINSVDRQSGKHHTKELVSTRLRYNDTQYCLYHYVKAEQIDIKRIYRPDKANDLLVITITERKDPW